MSTTSVRVRTASTSRATGYVHIALMLLLAIGLHLSPQQAAAQEGRGSGSPFAGYYLGLQGGYAWGRTSIKDGGTAITNPPFGAFSCGPALTGNYCSVPLKLEADGGLASITLGRNFTTGPFLLGLEAEFGLTNATSDKTLIRPFNDRDFAVLRYGWYTALTARLGHTIGRGLVYVKAGAALARIKHKAADIDLVGGTFQIYPGSVTSDDSVRLGLVLGAGVEYALTETVSLRAEYVHMGFASETSRSPDGDIYRHEADLHSVRIGLNWRLLPR
ncbi:MAG: outer membrane protein [Hyphomicrobiaceae bacterium]